MEHVFVENGLPAVIRTDNGVPFASTGVGGLSRLSVWWIKLGIMPERIAPGHPEQNGRHERLHATLKAETLNPPKANRREQQKAFDAFRREYNEERPHEALGQRPPASVYRPSHRSYPGREPEVWYPVELTVRRRPCRPPVPLASSSRKLPAERTSPSRPRPTRSPDSPPPT